MVVLVLINWCDKNLMIFLEGGVLLIEVADEENVIQNLCSIKLYSYNNVHTVQ